MARRRIPHLVFLIPEDWYVCSHRLPLIRAAVGLGWRVSVVTRVADHAAEIAAAGAEVHPLKLRRGFRSPLSDVGGWWHLVRIFRRLRPDLLHQVTPKSVLLGSLAANLAGRPPQVNALAGLGFLYIDESRSVGLARALVTRALTRALGSDRSWTVVQNEDDGDFCRGELGIPAARVVLIQGAGVDTGVFFPAPVPPPGPLRFVLPARLIRFKGIEEFAAAAAAVRQVRQDITFVLAGQADPESPSGIPVAQLEAWTSAGILEWAGHVTDMPALLRGCHAAVLPSYREGFPKALLEAAACGLPLLAADVAGCREICRHQVNGLLVPPRDAGSLADAVVRLADDADLRARYGAASRQLVEDLFSERIVVDRTLALYREILARGGGSR